MVLMNLRTRTARIHLLSATLLAAAAACSDGTGVDGPQSVSLNFQVAPAAALASAPGAGGSGGPLLVQGTNGTLSIDEVRVVVNQVELEPADGSCDLVDNSSSDDCPEFEAPPAFVDLPLDGTPVEAVEASIPAGTYKSLDFEIEDLEDDEDDPTEAAAIVAVRTQIHTLFPEWPEEAAAVVSGTFTPTGGAAVAFTVYLKAEIEVELDLVPNLTIADDGTASRSLTVDVRPDLWFRNGDGTVMDLSEWDWDTAQQTLEFELEMEEGFVKVEIED